MFRSYFWGFHSWVAVFFFLLMDSPSLDARGLSDWDASSHHSSHNGPGVLSMAEILKAKNIYKSEKPINFKASDMLLAYVPRSEAVKEQQVARQSPQKKMSSSQNKAQLRNAFIESIPSIKREIIENQVLIQHGVMDMGASDLSRYESPVHRVSISSFYIDAYEVRNLYYAAFLSETKPDMDMLKGFIDIDNARSGIVRSGPVFLPRSGSEDLPVILVTWEGANAYARWLGMALPTEAQWEFVSRNGGKEYAFSNHSTKNVPLEELGRNYSVSAAKIKSVTSGKPNLLGIYNMTGNAMEWCRDWLQSNYYLFSKIQDPEGPLLSDATDEETRSRFTHRAIRGGAFNTMEVHELRNERRWWAKPANKYFYLGFRVSRSIH